jgi:hypothetical protein
LQAIQQANSTARQFETIDESVFDTESCEISCTMRHDTKLVLVDIPDTMREVSSKNDPVSNMGIWYDLSLLDFKVDGIDFVVVMQQGILLKLWSREVPQVIHVDPGNSFIDIDIHKCAVAWVLFREDTETMNIGGIRCINNLCVFLVQTP